PPQHISTSCATTRRRLSRRYLSVRWVLRKGDTCVALTTNERGSIYSSASTKSNRAGTSVSGLSAETVNTTISSVKISKCHSPLVASAPGAINWRTRGGVVAVPEEMYCTTNGWFT